MPVGIKGLDSITVGPGDLSLAMTGNVDTSHPEVMVELERIIGVARAAGVFVGAGQGPDAELAQLQFKRGVQWLQAGDDIGFALNGIRKFGTREHHCASMRAQPGESPCPTYQAKLRMKG